MTFSHFKTLAAPALLALTVTAACNGGVGAPALAPQAEVRLKGEVVENIRLYEVDGPGVLRVKVEEGLDTPGEEVLVTYTYGDQASCENEAAFEQGRQIRRGTHVEVKGQIHSDHNLTLCGSPDAYIRPI